MSFWNNKPELNLAPSMFQISSIFPVDMKKPPDMVASEGMPETPPYSSVTSSSPCLVTVLNIGSVVGYIPFKIKQNSATGSYHVESIHFLRKILCALVHITVICMYIQFNAKVTVLSKPKELTSNFIQTFDFVTDLGTLALIFLSCYTFWRCQPQILEILEQSRVDASNSTKQTLKWIASMVFGIAYLTGNYVYRNYFEDNTSIGSLISGETFHHALISMANVLCDLYLIHCMIMSFFTYSVIAMVGLTMRGVRIHFNEKMNESLASLDINGGFEHYMALKQLTANITQAFGNQILVYYIISVAYFAKIPESSVWQRTVETVAMTSYFAMGALLWLVSAEFHMTVRDVVQNWATQMQDLDDLMVDTRIRLLSVVNDNLLDPIGVSCKFFTITYGFLGSMLGLIVTYAIIVFQMQTKPQPTAVASHVSDYIMETLFPSATTPSDV